LRGKINGKFQGLVVFSFRIKSRESEAGKPNQAYGRDSFCSWEVERRTFHEQTETRSFGIGPQENECFAESKMGKKNRPYTNREPQARYVGSCSQENRSRSTGTMETMESQPQKGGIKAVSQANRNSKTLVGSMSPSPSRRSGPAVTSFCRLPSISAATAT